MRRVLFISGFTMSVNDGSPFWDVADRMMSLSNILVFRQTWDKLRPEDLMGMDDLICYSYGASALFHALSSLTPHFQLKFKSLWLLAGVPRWLWGMFQDHQIWTIPAFFETATAFNVSPLLPDPLEPISMPIQNTSTRFTNVDLNSYCTGFRHVSIQSVPLWSDMIFEYLRVGV